MKQEALHYVVAILNRIDKMKIGYGDRLSMMMDIEYAEVDVEKLLTFPDFDFVHDIAGIARHFNRKTKKFDDCFVPRSSR